VKEVSQQLRTNPVSPQISLVLRISVSAAFVDGLNWGRLKLLLLDEFIPSEMEFSDEP
jgi:hypothetical protein